MFPYVTYNSKIFAHAKGGARFLLDIATETPMDHKKVTPPETRKKDICNRSLRHFCSALKISGIRHREARKSPIKEEVKVEIKHLIIFPRKKKKKIGNTFQKMVFTL